jgi:ABC-type Fe3+-hydroxamate transport system substrate-binding protein
MSDAYGIPESERVISLVPSLTELVFSLGAGGRLAGRTRFCIHPGDGIGRIPVVGGTKNPRIGKIRALRPGLVLANREENRREDVEAIQAFTEVLVTDISTVDEALSEIRRIGERLGAGGRADRLAEEIGALLPPPGTFSALRALYLIWREPWMAAGGDTYIHDVMKRYGMENAAGGMSRYPELTAEEMMELNPDVVLLSSEPYPFREKHLREVGMILRGTGRNAEDAEDAGETQRMAGGISGGGGVERSAGENRTRLMLVDGEWFSWYGPRMLPSFRALNDWRQKI